MSIFKSAIDVHKKLHEHVFHRRTTSGDHAERVGEPVDLVIKFIQASGIPKTDVGENGLSDPYFIANIDGKISFVSTVQLNTLTPVWNEEWMIKNVPSDANLRVDVYDKDEGSLNDDYIGSFNTDIGAGMHVGTLKGIVIQDRGTFGLTITSQPSLSATVPQYTFDGPIRYTRHYSPTVGFLTMKAPNGSYSRLWSTWKINIKGIPIFFGDNHQHWNVNYKAAQSIFQGPLSFGVRAPIQAGHRLLYARTTTNASGIIDGAESFWNLFRAGSDRPPKGRSVSSQSLREEQRIKPAVYTYVFGEDNMFRFSETGASFFVDFASKHALHSCCAETVRYSGEFHPRPVFPDQSGWASFNDDMSDDSVPWEIVIDNNSGTYSPDKALLHALKSLLEYNFSGLRVVVYDYKQNDAELSKSRDACREYAVKYRGVRKTELQPTAEEVGAGGGQTLLNMASSDAGQDPSIQQA